MPLALVYSSRGIQHSRYFRGESESGGWAGLEKEIH